jgi:hypothetical protein
MTIATTIDGYDESTRTVAVTFTNGEIVHKRRVNAVLAEHGGYDEAATAVRVEEVARGVAVKIGLGVIAAPSIDTDEEV